MKRDPLPHRPLKSLTSRRQFFKSATAGGIGVLAAPALLRARNLNEKLNIAIIGCGGRGEQNMAEMAGENIVALCDVNQDAIDRAAMTHAKARQYNDFRQLYDQAGDIDAVVVSTCEHTHAFATLPALQLRKHVYCEKPLTHNVWEARVIRQAAAKAKVATQMGTQIHASENFRQVIEVLRTGAIGPVREVHVWVPRAWGRQSSADAKQHGDIVDVQERPTQAESIPKGLRWDLWLGPAPQRPFNSVYVPGPKWYRWWDFGNGTMSDLGSHWVDLPFWAMGLQAPLTIEAQGPPPHIELAPASMQVTYQYGQRGDMPPLKLTWYQGVNRPDVWSTGAIPKWDAGILFVGDKGMLLADYGRWALLPETEFADYKRPDPYLSRSIGHHAEWIRACKTGEPTGSNFDYAGRLTEANHLGNVAYRVGKKLEWDADKLTVENAREAGPLIHREYRPGWTLA
jgi:predicted dehydrogenase